MHQSSPSGVQHLRSINGAPSLELSSVFSDKVAVVLGSDFPDSDVLSAVVRVLLVKPHSLTINPTRPMNRDGWIEIYDERHVAGEVLKFVWLVALNLQHSKGHARGDGGGSGE